MAEPLLRASGLVVGRPGEPQPVLAKVDLALAPGECVWLRGDTGSGKSTLLRLLAGLRGVERRAGTLLRSADVALLMQHVETQLLCTTVAEEVALGLRARGLSPASRERRVRDALAAVQLLDLAEREVDALSAGQKQRLVLAALLALHPGVLLLDEPSAALDPPSRRALAALLAKRKALGTALLIADHAPDELLPLVDRTLHIVEGVLAPGGGAPVAGALASSGESSGPGHSPCTPSSLARALDALRPGERVLVCGPNGSGKSTALASLARRAPAGGDVALVIQEPRRSLFARTVADEVDFGLLRRGVAARERRERVRELLERIGLRAHADRSPRRLSFGQQHRLAIAAALAARPARVLLDEPFAGLDAGARAALLAQLEDEQRRTGAALVIASHDRDPLARWCDRVFELSAGEAADA